MTAKRRLQRKPGKLRDALTQVQTAVRAIGGAVDIPEALKTLSEQTGRVERLAGALAGEYERLVAELEIQREVMLRLLTVTAGGSEQKMLDTMTAREASIRGEVMAERELRTLDDRVRES